jgi:hypothetical protein
MQLVCVRYKSDFESKKICEPRTANCELFMATANCELRTLIDKTSSIILQTTTQLSHDHVYR